MTCSRCGGEASPGATFCHKCGTRLTVRCARCHGELAAGDRFCSSCGAPRVRVEVPSRFTAAESYTPKHLAEKILTSRSALEGERKLITVMFADVKGSLELLGDRDPEEARTLLDAVLTRMIEAVHRYEGTVNQVMGDGVMALFGAPVAHEDHAVRACYAALRMQETIEQYAAEIRRVEGLYLQVRIGLNAGEVVVRYVGSDLQMDYTVVGQTAHLAARMEQIAAPGSILMTPDVLRLTESYVAVKALGPVAVKGLAMPIEVYELIGAGPVRSRLQAAAVRGLTHFVGRAAEMAVLHDALERVEAENGQVVAVVGEAGVGKSRLLHELIHSGRTRGWLVLESHAVSYGHTTPYLPVIDALRIYFEIEARDDGQAVREKVTGKLLLLDQSLQEAIPAILDLFEVLPDDHSFRRLHPPQRRQCTIDGLTQLILRESRLQPVVVVFEDLHWNDSLTLGLLDGLIDRVSGGRVLLLVSYRSEHRDTWGGRPHYRQLRLDPLSRRSLEELLQVLLGADPTLVAVKEFLMERTEGNPFFLEELLRTLVETRVLVGERGGYRLAGPFSHVQVPPTVQAVIAARIDRLPPPDKRLLQEAAVIGKDVAFGLLSAITGRPDEDLRAGVASLQAAEFLYETRLFPDLEYTFTHALTHDVAYAGLLQQRRREIHARIADTMEQLYSGRLSEQIERLAHHALRGERWPKALTYLRQAGLKAVERPANREAVALFEQALEVLTHLPQDRATLEQAVDIRFDIRNALQPLGDLGRILEYLREAEHLAAQLDDQRRLGWVASYLTEHFRMLGRPDAAGEQGERALAIARQLQDLALHVVTNLPMGLRCHALGEYRRAIELFEWNVTRLQGALQHERFGLFGLPSVFSRAFLARSLGEVGAFARGLAIGEDGVRLAEAADQPFSRVYAYLGLGAFLLRKGDFPRAIPLLERAVALGQAANIPVGLAYGASYLGYALSLVGRVHEGLPLLEQTADAATSKFVASHSLRLAYLGEAYLVAGRSGAAGEVAAQALALAHEHKERGHQAYALRLLGEVAMRHDEPTQAQAHFRNSLALAEELEMRPLLAHCHFGLAGALDGAGLGPAAAAHRAAARGLLRSLGMRLWRATAG